MFLREFDFIGATKLNLNMRLTEVREQFMQKYENVGLDNK